jgi:transcriptional regulator with XRE-family HTH domain
MTSANLLPLGRLFNMPFAQELKAECARLGSTQAEAATVLEVSPRAVWKWLHGDEPELAVTREGILARLKREKVKK